MVIGWQPVRTRSIKETVPQLPEIDAGRQAGAAPGFGMLVYRYFGADIMDNKEAAQTTNITEDVYRFTVIRQFEPQESPRLPYTFAQPQRPVAQPDHVSTRIQEQEVVKVVRNEIQSYMASGSAVKQFSRDDFAHIAERVYSSFARRLLVERERLGLR